jgi:lipopolysaccharide export LptBFGC system permease protein LptF
VTPRDIASALAVFLGALFVIEIIGAAAMNGASHVAGVDDSLVKSFAEFTAMWLPATVVPLGVIILVLLVLGRYGRYAADDEDEEEA